MFFILFCNDSLNSISFCFSFRYTAYWSEKYILYKVVPPQYFKYLPGTILSFTTLLATFKWKVLLKMNSSPKSWILNMCLKIIFKTMLLVKINLYKNLRLLFRIILRRIINIIVLRFYWRQRPLSLGLWHYYSKDMEALAVNVWPDS